METNFAYPTFPMGSKNRTTLSCCFDKIDKLNQQVWHSKSADVLLQGQTVNRCNVCCHRCFQGHNAPDVSCAFLINAANISIGVMFQLREIAGAKKSIVFVIASLLLILHQYQENRDNWMQHIFFLCLVTTCRHLLKANQRRDYLKTCITIFIKYINLFSLN